MLDDAKQLENINSTAVNDVSSEQSCTVTDIKSEWFDRKLKKRLSKAKWSATNMRGVQGDVKVTEMEERKLYYRSQ